MSDTAQSQAIMFEPTDGPEVRAGRGEPNPQEDQPGEVGQEAHPESTGREESGHGKTDRKDNTQSREQITFEQGYEELKGIVSRLDDPELPVHEMFEGFRRGKGLEKALRAYLQEREGELVELEEGNNLPEFEIASPSSGPVAG